MAFTYREGLGRPLTYQEMDDNLEYVEDLADSASDSASSASDSASSASDSAASAATHEQQAQIYAAAAQSAVGVPGLAGNAGKVLGVQQDEQGVEWQEPGANINNVEGVSESGLLLVTGDTIADDNGILRSGSSVPAGKQSVTEDVWYLGTDKQHTADATGTVDLDLAEASIFDLTLTGNTTLTISNANVPAGEARSIVVRIRQGTTARTLTWWPGITWLHPSTPSAPAAGQVVEYVLSYSSGGWIGRVGASS